MRPSIPPELQNIAARVQEQVEAEFSSPGEFDPDQYTRRIEQIWDEQPEEKRKLRDELQPKLQEYIEASESARQGRDDRLIQVRSIIRDGAYVAYGDVIVAPVEDQFDVLSIEMTNGANHDLSTDEIITALKEIDEKYGIDILDAGFDYVVFRLIEIPDGEEAELFRQQLLGLCPDLVETPADLSEKIELWWD
jgi:hypothetical protein